MHQVVPRVVGLQVCLRVAAARYNRGMLLLKKHLIALVRAGRKRQTIRLWKRPMVRAGQLAHTPGLGRVRILAVDELPALRALTRADALADGFASRQALLAEIARIYGPAMPAGTRLFRVRFAWPAGSAPRPPAARKKRPLPADVRHLREKLKAFVISKARG